VREFDARLEAARSADAGAARAARRGLLGLPLTVRNPTTSQGCPTTWGFPPQKDFKPAETRCRSQREGCRRVILGKTTCRSGSATAVA